MSKINYRHLISALLANLRGKNSSAQFSRRLGFTSNQIHRWESHHATMRWKDFIEIATTLKIPLAKRFDRHLGYQEDPQDFASLVQYILPTHDREDLAKLAGVSVQACSHWMRGKASPPLETVLKLVESGSFSLSTFVAIFIPLEKQSPLLRKILADEEKMKSSVLSTPWTLALLCLISNGLYGKKTLPDLTEALHQNLGIDVASLKKVLGDLAHKGVLTDKNGEVALPRDRHIDLSGTDDFLRESIEFWTHYGLQTANGPKTSENPTGRSGYMVFSINPKDLKEVYSLFAKTFHDLEKISARCEKNGRTFVFSSLLSDVDSPLLGKVIKDFSAR